MQPQDTLVRIQENTKKKLISATEDGEAANCMQAVSDGPLENSFVRKFTRVYFQYDHFHNIH